MTTDHEAAVQEAVHALAAALLAAARANEPDPGGPDRLYSVDEAARHLGIGRSALYGEMAAGRLRSLKVGRCRLVPSGAITDRIAQDGG